MTDHALCECHLPLFCDCCHREVEHVVVLCGTEQSRRRSVLGNGRTAMLALIVPIRSASGTPRAAGTARPPWSRSDERYC